MRTNNSIKNSVTSLICNTISYLVAFIAQALFIRMLDTEYLGLNGLFTNVLSMLSIFELGIGSAIVFNLYKPVADNDKNKIASLLLFYKKAYNIIASIIFVVGIAILPFITFFVGEVTIDINIYIVYLLFLLSTVSSYILVYKRNLLVAYQQNYIINIINAVYLIILNIIQLLIIYISKNYYLYLIIKIVFQVLENIIISLIVNIKYKDIVCIKNQRLDKTIEKNIFSCIKALVLHKVGSIVVLGTDNIIISKFFGIVCVGIYSNYSTIVAGISSLFSRVISSTTASVGNLLVSNDNDRKYDVFKKMRFVNFWISVFTSVCLFVIVQPFICIWVGSEYLLHFDVIVVLTFNYFQTMQRQTYMTFKDSAGIWIEDKFVPLVEASLNIIFSIICLKLFGLVGVFIGTFVSSLALWCYSYPKFVYKKLFNRTYKEYVFETLGYILLFLVIAFITYGVSTLFIFDSYLLQVIINFIICLIIPNTIMILLFRKSDNYKYFKDLFLNILSKINMLKRS